MHGEAGPDCIDSKVGWIHDEGSISEEDGRAPDVYGAKTRPHEMLSWEASAELESLATGKQTILSKFWDREVLKLKCIVESNALTLPDHPTITEDDIDRGEGRTNLFLSPAVYEPRDDDLRNLKFESYEDRYLNDGRRLGWFRYDKRLDTVQKCMLSTFRESQRCLGHRSGFCDETHMPIGNNPHLTLDPIWEHHEAWLDFMDTDWEVIFPTECVMPPDDIRKAALFVPSL